MNSWIQILANPPKYNKHLVLELLVSKLTSFALSDGVFCMSCWYVDDSLPPPRQIASQDAVVSPARIMDKNSVQYSFQVWTSREIDHEEKWRSLGRLSEFPKLASYRHSQKEWAELNIPLLWSCVDFLDSNLAHFENISTCCNKICGRSKPFKEKLKHLCVRIGITAR